jgi:hypothetical protein
MLYPLTILAAVFFVLHVVFLFASFGGGGFSSRRYFLSHLTLWITGLLVFLLAVLFAGKGVSGALDYFDTPGKRLSILGVAAALSLIAHGIVRGLVLPGRQRK